MPETNTGTVICEFRDAYGDLLRQDAELRFRNLKVQSLNFLHTAHLAGEPLRLVGIPAFPAGNWQVDINIKRFRFKSVFIDLPSNGETTIKETFFVKPNEAIPQFPTANDIQTLPRWRPLAQALTSISYDELEDQQKAGLLNLFAKMSDESTPEVFSDVIEIFKVKPARIYAKVRAHLLDHVLELAQRFHEQADGGSLHKFDDGWTRLAAHASFKTPDVMGNLQLTFARNQQNDLAVDADLDDHKGLKHAFDVIKHLFSGDTNPYDIHEVLVKFQGIDPGYRLF